jgi:protein-S-isoprenylcysteine O-methyltransferase Ste14
MDHAWLLTVGWPKAFWSSYVVFGLFEAWVWRRDRRAASGENLDKGSLRAVVLVIIAGVFTAFYVAKAFDFARIVSWKVEWRALSVVLIWGGLALRLWAILTLGAFFRVTVHLQDGHRMITTGPYRIVRNPAYLGSLLTLVGIGVGLGNWLSVLALFLAAVIAFSWRIRVEDAAMNARFGEAHVAYRKRKAALIPFVW